MSNTHSDITPVEPLTGGLNYKRWAGKVMMILESKDIDYVIFEDSEKSTETVAQVPAQTDKTVATEKQASSADSTAEKTTQVQATAALQTTRTKFEKDNKTARAEILQRVSNPLFDIYLPYRSAKVIWELMKAKFGVDDVGRRKYAVHRWLHFVMTDDKTVTEQVHDFENLVADMKSEGALVNDAFLLDALVDKLPDSWLDFKNKSKHELKNQTLEQLINTINIEEENRLVQKSSNFSDSIKVNVVESGGGFDRSKTGEGARNQRKSSKPNNNNRVKNGKVQKKRKKQ
ncbi:PREDICTED: uncharacterized protein LOC109183387 [Ipomoea nil]|uniref:uncharacterized protein LOC109183387 n=1 Tax=Ipomoea nil TaxID=35883 RepID=UPI000900D1C0|nr:PREDICTED: uncharacterized protein LOC109183387 [Ipomoea nil]